MMKSARILMPALCLLVLSCGQQDNSVTDDLVANPLNLEYRYSEPGRYKQSGCIAHREAADPLVITFKGKYYMFASKTGGYWSSSDLVHWDIIRPTTIPSKYLEQYAPTVLVYNDELYYMASPFMELEPYQAFRTSDPDGDSWEKVDMKIEYGFIDPTLYQDDDGQVYLYCGCSNVTPIYAMKVDPSDGFKVLEGPVAVIEHNHDIYGWEARGENNEIRAAGYNEGATMIKYKGKYYLQYASDATQFRSYADGVYVSDNPMGPFTYCESSPFSIKQGGFIGGVGHGHTFCDKYGNYWRVGTMKLSQREKNERRLGLFPAFFDDMDELHTETVFTDYPFHVPQRKFDPFKEDLSAGWNVISYAKDASASSELPGFEASRAVDERIESFWVARTGDAGEWLCVDLGARKRLNAVQVNLADYDFDIIAPDTYIYKYRVDASVDGKKWFCIADLSANDRDLVHNFIVLDKPKKVRYVKITNLEDCPGKFSLMDLRLFGNGGGSAPVAVSGVEVSRDDSERRDIFLKWDEVPGADGYVVRWGLDEDHMFTARMVTSNSMDGKCFNTGCSYVFTVEAFNENGRGPASAAVTIK